MRRSHWSLEGFSLLVYSVALFAGVHRAEAQNQDPIAAFFEGKHVVVLMDMPGTQKGVDV